MALETLKNVKKIGKFNVVIMDELREKFPEKFNESGAMDYKWFEKDIRPTNHIYVRHDVNSLSFTIQNGPVKESGVNGCQVDTILQAGLMILEGLNKNLPCEFNIEAIAQLNVALDDLKELEDITPGDYTKAINHVKAALHQMDLRTQEREARGVEGKNQA